MKKITKKLAVSLMVAIATILATGLHVTDEGTKSIVFAENAAQETETETTIGPCRTDAECYGRYEACINGQCVNRGFCTTSLQCLEGESCIERVCVAIGERLEDTRFPVGTHLRLVEEQPTEYFEGEESPIVSLILRVIEFATMIMGAIAAILIIIAGFMFMLSQGNDQELTKAKDMLKFAVMGLAVAFLAYAIVTFVQSIFIWE